MKRIKDCINVFVSLCFLLLGMIMSIFDWKHGIGANHRPI